MVNLEGENKKGIDINSLAQNANGRAQDSYKYESGRRKAVDSGQITMEDLSIYYFVNDFVLNNSEGVDLLKDMEAVKKIEQKAFSIAARVYNISEQKAEEIFMRVANLPEIYEG